MRNRLSHSILTAGVVMVLVAWAPAQDMPITITAPPIQPEQAAGVQSQGPAVLLRGSGGKEMGFQFVGAEPAVSANLVKGAPYSLEASVNTEQTLADGNRIVHHQVVHVYRDSEGRTRREETLSAIGPWAASGTPPTIVTIQDPVSGVSYSLDPQDKVATKLPKALPGQIVAVGGIHVTGGGMAAGIPPEASKSIGPVTAFANGDSGAGVVVLRDGMASSMANESSESLGKETIAGVAAEGTRLTTTIPAESMGNEKPIEIARERWYSPELQIVLRSKQSDPRFGVTTYEVTKLDRSNPARSLFEVPHDYQIRKSPEPPIPPAPPE
jgi:hypothetical protein